MFNCKICVNSGKESCNECNSEIFFPKSSAIVFLFLLGSLVKIFDKEIYSIIKFGFGKRYNEPTYDMSGINNTRVYENILGPSTNPDNLDIYNEFVDEDENEEYDTQIFNFDPTGFNTRNQNLDVGELVAKVTGPALIQMRTLEKKKAMSEYGGTPLTIEEENKLNQLKKMDADQAIYSAIV